MLNNILIPYIFIYLFGCLFKTSMSIYKMVLLYMIEQITSLIKYIKGSKLDFTYIN